MNIPKSSRYRSRYASACAGIFLSLVVSYAGAETPEFELTYGSSLGPNHTFSLADRDWITYVESRSQGRIRIKPFWSATLISSDNSVVELRHGVTDVAMITPIYMRAGMHAIRAQTGFYIGGDKIETQVEVFHC